MAQELIDKIRAAAQARGIDPELALSIARAESSFDPQAKARTSSASGLFQVTKDTWKEFGGKPGRQLDPDENIRVGLDIIAKNTNTLKNALGREPRPAEVYAAHYFGPSGAKNFLSADPETPIASILGERAVKANPNLKGKTAGQVLAQLEGKVGSPASASAPAVSRETPPAPTRTPAEEIVEPALRSGMTAQAPASPADNPKLAALGPGYQAALALSFLSDEDEKEGRDPDTGPSVAEEWLKQTASRPAALALSDISVKSPFEALGPQPQMLAKGGEVEEPSLFAVPDYAETVAYEMYPGQKGQFTQQDAARHMLAAGTLARKYGPTAAEMLGRLHEIKTSPFRWIGSKLGVSEMPVDYEQDLHNNQLGIEAGMRSKSQKELEDLIQSMAEQAREQKVEGKPWVGRPQRPVKRAEGGEAEPTAEELAAASRPATVNPMIRRQGEAARRLAAMRDVNTLPDPRTYAAVSGFFGVAPDEQGFSALHPDISGIKKAGEAGFYAGTAAQVAPIAAVVKKALPALADVLGLGKKSSSAAKSAREMLEEVPVAAAEPTVSRETPELFLGKPGPRDEFERKYKPLAEPRPEITGSPEFQEKFKGSKVVDYRGEPLIMYRSTPSDEMAFQSQATRARAKGEYPAAGTNEGIYFTHLPELSAGYGKTMYPVYLDIKNPFVIPKDAPFTVSHVAQPTTKNSATSMFVTPEHLEWYRKHGYDGIINLASNEVVAFSPSQAISAISPKASMHKAHGGYVSL